MTDYQQIKEELAIYKLKYGKLTKKDYEMYSKTSTFTKGNTEEVYIYKNKFENNYDKNNYDLYWNLRRMEFETEDNDLLNKLKLIYENNTDQKLIFKKYFILVKSYYKLSNIDFPEGFIDNIIRLYAEEQQTKKQTKSKRKYKKKNETIDNSENIARVINVSKLPLKIKNLTLIHYQFLAETNTDKYIFDNGTIFHKKSGKNKGFFIYYNNGQKKKLDTYEESIDFLSKLKK